jgi:hypothetical protein
MHMSRPFRQTCLGLVLLAGVGLTPIADASEEGPSHIRTSERYVSSVLAAAAAHSPTVRQLLGELDASDVVAYMKIDKTLPLYLGGKTWFVVSAAGTRYVQCLVTPIRDTLTMAVMVAHELAHAVEVSRDPAIVDPASMAQQFLTSGTVRTRGNTTLVETEFARDISAQVRRELTPFLAEIAAAAVQD